MKYNLFIIVHILFIIRLSAQEFQMPESAVYDPVSKCYYISNFGDGNIIMIDSTGARTYFKTGLSKTLGMIMYQNNLYVATGLNMIKGFDISDASLSFELRIDDALFLNDITCDENGTLYVTDSNADAVYRVNKDLGTYTLLIKTKSSDPNGIIYDKFNHRLVLCYFRNNASIDQIKLDDSLCSTIIATRLNNLDGITMDESGNFYISAWDSGSFSTGFSRHGTIYRYDNMFSQPPEILSGGHYGPADIYYNRYRKELVIPLLLASRVEFIPIK